MAYKGKKRCVFPEKAELVAVLQQLSQRYYGSRYLVSKNIFDQERPQRWLSASAILRAYGCSQDAAGWRALMAQLGLQVAVAPVGVALYRKERACRLQTKLDEPVTHQSAADYRQAEEAYGYGFKVIERWRPLRCWLPKKHRYHTYGVQRVFELC